MKLPLFKKRNLTVISPWKKRPLAYLLLGVTASIGFVFIFFALPPTFTFNLSGVKVSIIPLLFLSMGVGVFSVVTYIFGSAKHGVLASLFCLIYFWLRLNKLFHPLFTVLLVALFLTLELLFSAKKNN